jgi:hypothetical protein
MTAIGAALARRRETQEPNGPEDPEQAICTHRIPLQGGSLNTDSHSQCERQVAIETDPSFWRQGLSLVHLEGGTLFTPLWHIGSWRGF